MKTVLPAAILLTLCFALDASNLYANWEHILIAFAALVLVPRGLQILNITVQPLLQWGSAGALTLAFAWSHYFPGLHFLALPYLLWAAWLSVSNLTDILIYRRFKLTDWLRLFALAYWTIGALWAFVYLADIPILGFSKVITSLTAAHFHVAGFALTVLVFAINQHFSGRIARVLGIAALFGMPLVAAGIVATQIGYDPCLEHWTASLFACFAFVIAIWHLWAARKSAIPAGVPAMWIAGACCLILGAALAAAYAQRFWFPIEWLSIQNMKIWHGTLNTLGFATLTMAGWRKFLSL